MPMVFLECKKQLHNSLCAVIGEVANSGTAGGIFKGRCFLLILIKVRRKMYP